MEINIHVQDEQVTFNVVEGEINTGKPPVLQEISITKDGTYTPDVGVDGFSKVEVQVLPTDMLDGLEDGWDVMFYDEHKRGLASYSIKQGHTINPPVYDCKAWQTADGTNVTFPYTPTGDVIFYVLNASYADQLYEHYGIDKAVYPYLMISKMDGCRPDGLAIGKSVYWWGTNNAGVRNGYWQSVGASSNDMANDDIEAVVASVMSSMAKLPAATEAWGFKNQSNYSIYCNFDPTAAGIPFTLATVYRLDE